MYLDCNLYCKDSLSSVIRKPESHLGTVNYPETSLSQGDVILEEGSNNWAVTVQSFHVQR